MKVPWKRATASLLVLGSVMVWVTAPVQASPNQWTQKITWDLRPYGGVDYGFDEVGPTADVQGWVDKLGTNDDVINGVTPFVAMIASIETAIVRSGYSFGKARLKWCVNSPSGKMVFHMAAIGSYKEKPGYTFWDRLLGREEYELTYSYFLTGCGRV